VGAATLTAFGGALPTGSLQPVRGRDACIAPANIASPCRPARQLRATMAMSRDGRSVYTIGGVDARSAIAVLARNARTGSLHQLPGRAGCVLRTISRSRACLTARLNNPAAIAVTPDGREVIWTNPPIATTVAAMARSTRTGALSPLRCSGVCASLLRGAANCANGVAPSPDGRSVYVTACTGLVVLRRDPASGQMTQPAGAAGCVQRIGADGCARAPVTTFSPSGPTLSRDGRMLYVLSSSGNRGVFVFTRDPSTGALTAGPCYLKQPRPPCESLQPDVRQLVLSPDGRNAYGVALFPNALVTFSRDPGTGALTTVAQTPIAEASDAVLTPDGRTLYVRVSTGILVFARAADGSLHAPASPYARVPLAGAFHTTGSMLVSPDGRFAYATSGDAGDLKPKRIVTFRRTP
jgi:DNA-binding beta-propeller fold protein YncE